MYRLAGISEDKGDTIAAGQYYRILAEKYEQTRDGRVFAVKAKIAELEGNSQ